MVLFSDNLRIIFNQYMENLSLTRNECSCMMLLNGRCIKNPKKRNQKKQVFVHDVVKPQNLQILQLLS